MSRGGGRGGGRGRGSGGRGGGRSVAANSVPWTMDSEIVIDGKPSELFPPYDVPQAPSLSRKEDKQVSYFLLFREQCHDGPLYTQARTWTTAAGGKASGRSYGQDQINKRYGQTSKATVDPFLAVPTYSQRFNQVERALPDLGSRPFAKEFFPPELHKTLDGLDGGHDSPPSKRRKTAAGGEKILALPSITELKTAEELFLPAGDISYDKALQVLNNVEKRAAAAEGGADGDVGYLSGEDDDEWVKTKEGGEDGEDNGVDAEAEDQYEDESGDDDYNAEAYFDGNQDDDEGDDGGDDGGDYM
ncbi:DNA-directed RNA polymerase III subunit Rpc31-domain-containing protein [Bombardia bombarda]|uniref:DNA-directed RNA polymerase III subunit n=1 Tax=Bombardia bombarda TaxID=252184 RepID=A0AA39WUF2_9PEZI|nr:DNA-directed RNA polymerase III subunit Rpc31-domain-containing protein [Bombardia bombarda]